MFAQSCVPPRDWANVYARCEHVADGHQIDWTAIGFLGPVDRKAPNVGLLNGAIVMIDYDMSWNDCPHSHPARDLDGQQIPPLRSSGK